MEIPWETLFCLNCYGNNRCKPSPIAQARTIAQKHISLLMAARMQGISYSALLSTTLSQSFHCH